MSHSAFNLPSYGKATHNDRVFVAGTYDKWRNNFCKRDTDNTTSDEDIALWNEFQFELKRFFSANAPNRTLLAAPFADTHGQGDMMSVARRELFYREVWQLAVVFGATETEDMHDCTFASKLCMYLKPGHDESVYMDQYHKPTTQKKEEIPPPPQEHGTAMLSLIDPTPNAMRIVLHIATNLHAHIRVVCGRSDTKQQDGINDETWELWAWSVDRLRIKLRENEPLVCTTPQEVIEYVHGNFWHLLRSVRQMKRALVSHAHICEHIRTQVLEDSFLGLRGDANSTIVF